MLSRRSLSSAALCLILTAGGLALAGRPAYVLVPDDTGANPVPYYPVTQPAPPASIPPVSAPPVVTPRTKPSTVPDPQPANVVPAGQPIDPFLRAARPGDTVYLARGATYPPVVAPDLRPHGVTLAGWGEKTLPRPVVGSTGGDGIYLWTVDGFAVVDVTVRGSGLPAKNSAGINLWGCRGTTLTRVEVTGHRMGLTCQAANGRTASGLTVTRCWIHDGGPGRDGVDGSAVYVDSTDGVNINANLIERWGWSDDYAGSERNHLIYLKPTNKGSVSVTGNLLADSSSHGIQARGGGTVANNLILDCPIGISFGLVNGSGPILPGGASGEVTGNTVVGTRLLAGGVRAYGLEMSNTKAVLVAGNTFALDAVPRLPDGSAPRLVPGLVTAVKLDVCNLSDDNPAKGTEKLARGVTFGDNAAAWPVLYWAHPKYGPTVPPAFTAADYAAVRERAVRTRAEWRAAFAVGS